MSTLLKSKTQHRGGDKYIPIQTPKPKAVTTDTDALISQLETYHCEECNCTFTGKTVDEAKAKAAKQLGIMRGRKTIYASPIDKGTRERAKQSLAVQKAEYRRVNGL